MSFIWPWLLFSLLLVPIFMMAYRRALRRRQKAADDLGPLGMMQTSSGGNIRRWRHIPPVFFTIGLALILFGLARPEMYVDLPKVHGTVILAFDVSQSMDAEDMEPTRMEAAKEAARIFVENQPSTIDIGVVAFSNGGLVVQTPTDDQVLVLDTINRLTPQGGTSLGQGIFTSLNAIVGEAIPIDPETLEEGAPPPPIGNYPSAVVLLLTDGENTQRPNPVEIANLAGGAGVRIFPVGIGSASGAVLEIDGYNVVTALNEPVLQEIANLTNGEYYHAEDAESLRDIYQNVDLRLSLEGEKMEVTAIFAGLSLLFFLIGGGLSLLWFGRMPL